MRIFLVVLVLMFFNCSLSSKGYDVKVNNCVVVEAKLIGKYMVMDSFNFKIYKDKIFTKYEYKSITNKKYYTKNIIVKKNILNDSVLIFNDKKSVLIDSLSCSLKGKKITVYKYLYDLANWIDEEEEYYFTKEHGLVYQKGLGWSYHYLFNREYLAEIQDSILKSTRINK